MTSGSVCMQGCRPEAAPPRRHQRQSHMNHGCTPARKHSQLPPPGFGNKTAASPCWLPVSSTRLIRLLHTLSDVFQSITIPSRVHLLPRAAGLPLYVHKGAARCHQLIISSAHPSRCCTFLALTYCYQSAPVVKCQIQ